MVFSSLGERASLYELVEAAIFRRLRLPTWGGADYAEGIKPHASRWWQASVHASLWGAFACACLWGGEAARRLFTWALQSLLT